MPVLKKATYHHGPRRSQGFPAMKRNRLMKEYKECLKQDEAEGTQAREIVLAPKMDSHNQPNMYEWRATIMGPDDSPFAGFPFDVELKIPENYPLEAPSGTFITKIFHPNVHFKTGEICLDILKSNWSPAWTLDSVCRAIQTLMSNGEHDSPLNCDAGNMLRAGDLRAYRSMASMYCALHCQKRS